MAATAFSNRDHEETECPMQLLIMEELKKDTVRMKNPENVKNLISNIISGGKDQIQVIADFDRTLSKFRSNGNLVPTCHNVLESPKLPEFKVAAKGLVAKYYPIEIDSKLTIEQKIPHMIEWWTEAHEILTASAINQSLLQELVEDAHIQLRDGSKWMFDALHKAEVPLLIFSAGLGDIIELTLKTYYPPLYDNMKVVSNYMSFDEQGKITGFHGNMIHVFNKNESALHDADYFKKLKGRENVVLLGDSMGDLQMSEGANAKNLLRIGFLNDKIEECLPQYLDVYDIVLISDETMDVPNAILKKVLKTG